MTIFLVIWGLDERRQASVFVASESKISASEERQKTQIQSEKDIEKFRSRALEDLETSMRDWRENSATLRQISRTILFGAVIPAVTSVVLAYAIYGLCIKKRMT